MSGPSSISIALCTYNGARFLEEQLQSIARQTRPPDELIVCDDQSSDGTLEIVSRFAAKAPFRVSCFANESRLGVTRNFERAIGLCSGEVIFLCDQDDFWLPNKIELLMRPFATDPAVGLVFSDAFVTDRELNRFEHTMWQTVHLTAKRQSRMNGEDALGVLIRRHVVTGATLAFRAALRDQILPIPAKSFHDAWVAAVAAMVSRVVAVSTPLILYRQHGGNVIGAASTSLLVRFRGALQLSPEWFDLEIEQATSLALKLQSTQGHPGRSKYLADLQQRIMHLKSRREMFNLPVMRKAVLVARELCSLRYWMYSAGLPSAILDLLVSRRGMQKTARREPRA